MCAEGIARVDSAATKRRITLPHLHRHQLRSVQYLDNNRPASVLLSIHFLLDLRPLTGLTARRLACLPPNRGYHCSALSDLSLSVGTRCDHSLLALYLSMLFC